MASRWYSTLVRENAYGIVTQALILASGVASAIIFPNILGPVWFGYYSLIFALANFFIFFSELGLATALMKLIPASIVKKQTAAYYRFFSRTKYALTIVSSVLLFISSDYIATTFFKQPELGIGIRVSCLFLFCYSLVYTFYDFLFAAVKRNKYVFYLALIFQTSRLMLPVIIYYIYRSYTSFILGLGLAALISLVLSLLLERRLPVLREGERTHITLDYKTLKKYFFYGALASFGAMLLQWMDSIVVGVYINPAEVGVYRVGVMWMSVVWLLIPFSSRVFLALYSEKTETLEKDKINTVYSYSLKYSLVIAFLIMTGVWLTSDYFIGFIYGQAYAQAAPILLIFSFLALESALNAINTPLLQGIGRIDIQTKYSVVVGFLSVLGSIYAARYGITGVAFAITSIRTISILLLTSHVLLLLKSRIKAGAYLKPLIISTATYTALMPFKPLVTTLPQGLLYASFVVAVYCTLVVALKAVSLAEIRKVVSALTER